MGTVSFFFFLNMLKIVSIPFLQGNFSYFCTFKNENAIMGTPTLVFKPITWDDRQLLTERLRHNSTGLLNYSFVVAYLYRHAAGFQMSFDADFLWIKEYEHGEWQYLFPMGCAPYDKALDKWRDSVLAEGDTANMLFDEGHVADMQSWAAQQVASGCYACEVHEMRDDFEYVYESEALASLAGHALKAKRNFVHAFTRSYDWSTEYITSDNLSEVLEFDSQWNTDIQIGENSPLKLENEALQEAFAHYADLPLRGLLLRVDDKVVAFAIGCPLTDTMYAVLFEKADRRYKGAYAMINCEFAGRIAFHYPYINRAEDGGNEGLRQAKLSYMPARMLKVYQLRIQRLSKV